MGYNFSPSRAGKYARGFLGNWNAGLVCDDFAGYKADLSKASLKSAAYALCSGAYK